MPSSGTWVTDFEMGFLSGLELAGLDWLSGCSVMGLQPVSLYLTFLCGTWGLNSGPRDFVANILLTELSPQLCQDILFWFVFVFVLR